MDELELIIPNNAHEFKAKEYIEEFNKYNSRINGSGGLEDYKNFGDWLEYLEKKKESKEGEVPRSTFFAIRKYDNKIVGMVNIRHRLNKHILNEYGSIGYAVRPTERKKGYANQILKLALEECRKIGMTRALLVCANNNVASKKTIIHNGGIFWDKIYTNCEGENTKRYWIYL